MARKPKDPTDPFGDKAWLAKQRPQPATEKERRKPMPSEADTLVTSSPDPTREKRVEVGPGKPPVEHQFKPGNPGRPKGSRNKLGEAFIADMYADWQDHGAAVIAKVRDEKPDAYLKVVASILPQQLNVRVSEFDELSDEQLDQRIRSIARALELEAGVIAASGREAKAQAGKPLN